MIRLTHDQPVPEALRGAILALGNFDGFHLGHQAVVGRAIALGFHQRRPVIVATFDPHPVRHFRPDAPPFRLTSLDQREALFAHAGADAMLVFRFGDELAGTSAQDFVADILGKRLGVAGVVTGDDFSFGKGRAGNVELLADLGQACGIAAEAVAPVLVDGVRVSSGRIREALEAGDPGTATHLLTRPFAVEALVERGDGRGHDFGFPTANVRLGDYQRPAYGIYAVRVRLDDGSEHCGVASFGIRPMFEPPEELLEAHLFDWDGDLYGRKIEIDLVAYLRPEAKFDSVDALVARMREDEDEARRLLDAAKPITSKDRDPSS
jgi:riboflavin kinase/FMN adenylyltransferase